MGRLFVIGTGAFVALGLSAGAAEAADAAAGAGVFRKKCVTCHTVEPGRHKAGPSLAGVYGRKAGGTDFPRYKGLIGAEFTWDDEKLDAYIKDPKSFVEGNTANKGTGMTFKLADDAERADVIDYLKTVK